MTDRTVDANGLEVLTIDDCWRRLRRAPAGRLAFIAHGEPYILPVNPLLEDEAIWLVTRPGAKLDAALARPGTPVAFEIDHLDAVDRTGWSVLVRGHLTPIMDGVEQARLDRLGRPAWIDVFRDRRWLRLDPVVVSGRRLPPSD